MFLYIDMYYLNSNMASYVYVFRVFDRRAIRCKSGVVVKSSVVEEIRGRRRTASGERLEFLGDTDTRDTFKLAHFL